MLGVDRPEPGQRAGERIAGPAGGDLRREAARLRHHQVPASDQGLLVGRGDDLAGTERGEDGSQAYDAAGGDDHEVHVVAGRELDHGVLAGGPFRAGRQVLQPCERLGVGQRDDDRAELTGLLGECGRVVAGREGHDPEGIGVGGQDLDGLRADRTGGAQQRDAAPLRRGGRRHTA
jgi:hypothetical protein